MRVVLHRPAGSTHTHTHTPQHNAQTQVFALPLSLDDVEAAVTGLAAAVYDRYMSGALRLGGVGSCANDVGMDDYVPLALPMDAATLPSGCLCVSDTYVTTSTRDPHLARLCLSKWTRPSCPLS